MSIGSDAVLAAERLVAANWIKDGTSSIEQISERFGTQAVVISVDAKRVSLSQGMPNIPESMSQIDFPITQCPKLLS